MRGQAWCDVWKVWLYVGAAVLLGAWMSPHIYNAGRALAEVAAVKPMNGPLEWLARRCAVADFSDFYRWAQWAAAWILCIPFVEWLRGGRAAPAGKIRSFCLPSTGNGALKRNPKGLRQAMLGFIMVTFSFGLLVAALVIERVISLKIPVEGLIFSLGYNLLWALAFALFQEFLFRGLVMGIFLRAMRPTRALGLSIGLFALIHYLYPPVGLQSPDPDGQSIGFLYLKDITARLFDPTVMFLEGTPLLVLGSVLTYARWRTVSLWLPVGLHAGWIFANGLLPTFAVVASRAEALMWIFSFLPLAGIHLARHLSRPKLAHV